MIRVPIVLLALTVHEFCHAYFALRMGDPTAYRMGRCTLNPLAHLDLLGTICLMFAPIGWAKPVPVNPINFHDWRKGILVSTAAGPLSNLAQAVVWALLLRGLIFGADYLPAGPGTQQFINSAVLMAYVAVLINVGLAVFNCLPLYPLDGFHILQQMIKPSRQQEFAETARYGPYLLIGLVLLGNYGNIDLLGRLVRPPAEFILSHVAGLG